MTDEPSIEQLLMLGSMAPKSQEEDKPTVDVKLTAVEIQALAVLSNARFQALFLVDDKDSQEMAAIYLGITSKLMIGALAAAVLHE